jgi:hypothetical protein
MTLPIISIDDIKKTNPHCFIVYSDNILESTNILDLLSFDNDFLNIIGVSYEPVDQPIYLFKDKDSNLFFCIKVAGRYENWDLPGNVDSIIHFIDKPDFVIIDGLDGKGVFVGETTGTANVGNSQWQREGRKIAAAEKGLPLIYQTYYSGTDRSMYKQEDIDGGKEMGQVREPSSLQVINHFIYSLRYKTPSLVIYYPNDEYDNIIGLNRDYAGKELFKHYISVCLLYQLDSKHKKIKKEIENEIYKRMLSFITEDVNNRKSIIKRIDKDFPVEPASSILKNNGDNFIKFVVDYINGDVVFNDKFDITKWDYSTFSSWSHRYKGTQLLNLLENSKIPTFSYLKGATKAGFVLDTKKLINFLNSIYPKDFGKFEAKLNPNIPTLFIPTLMFQKKEDKFIYKVDPATGEIVAFAELFARDIKNVKSMNTLIYVHVEGPNSFSTTTKLFRAIKRYADCLIINERIYEF